jgi:hypothetical protein
MDRLADDLLDALDEAEELLRSSGEAHWADWLSRGARDVRARAFEGVEHVLRAFGGMGSINDVVLPADDARLRRLLTRIFDAATELRRLTLHGTRG